MSTKTKADLAEPVAGNQPGAPADAAQAAPASTDTQEGIVPTAAAPLPPDAAEVVGAAYELPSYRVTSPLRHNGTRYKIGDLVELSTSEFWHLRRLGVVIDEASVG